MRKIKMFLVISIIFTTILFWIHENLIILHWPLQKETNFLKITFLLITITLVIVLVYKIYKKK